MTKEQLERELLVTQIMEAKLRNLDKHLDMLARYPDNAEDINEAMLKLASELSTRDQ